MKHIKKLQRYWQDWEPKLTSLMRDRGGARLSFPATLVEKRRGDSTVTLAPSFPICIHNAPQKASSKKRGTSHKLTILINGSFELTHTEDHPCLKTASCNVTFLRCEQLTGDSLRLDLIDALHFDIEPEGKSFHPIFHAQRGRSLDDETCRQALSDVTHISVDKIQFAEPNPAIFGTPYLRLPTPQLDVFSVITMIVADYFCNSGDIQRGSNVKDLFADLLKFLTNSRNIVREGPTSQTLKARVHTEPHISAAHWYPEWV
jgi:hypothetical protein